MRSGLAGAALALCFCTGAFAQTEDEAPLPPEETAAEQVDEYGNPIVPVTPPGPGEGALVYNLSQHPLVPVGEGDVQVSVENSTVVPPWGYTPIRVFVENVGKQPYKVRLEFSPSNSGATIRRDVEVPAAQRVAVTLLSPSGANYGQLTAFSPGIKNGSARQSVYFTAATQAILALGSDDEFQKAAKRPPDFNSYNTMVRALEADSAPSELAAYVGFNEVVVLVPYERLSEATRRALESYAATGGTLVVVHPPRNVDTYLPLLTSNARTLSEYGFGHVRLCGEDALACANAMASDLPLAQREVKPVASTTSFSSRYVYDPYGTPVPEAERFLLPQATAPVGRFLLIILAFTLAIGPGSIWVARRRGPPMLLLTIPATAAVTCLLIVGYSVLVDGFAVHAATRGYTLLDSKNKRAITVGVEAFYANMAPGDAKFDATTAVLGPAQNYGSDNFASVDWTQGALFDSDFIPSRTYREWGFATVQPTRARLLAKTEGKGVTVENALGSDIRVATVRMNGELWLVRDVPEGGRKQAEKAGVPPEFFAGAGEFRSRFGDRTLNRTELDLKDGQFLAQVEGPSFLPTGGLRLSQHTSEHLVRGEVER